MFDSRSKTIKVGGYIIVGFFTLIIVISFGMPDFMSKMGMDENIVAVVNGESIYRLDFIRYRDTFAQRMKDTNKKETQKLILDNLIMRRLMLQKAREVGIKVSDNTVKKSIKNIRGFQNKNGKFDKESMDRYLTYYHQSLTDFYIMIKEDLILNELRKMIYTGIAVPPDEIITENAIDKSEIQIKYCFISSNDLKKRLKRDIDVSEKEIDVKLKNSKTEIKDPKTDRNRVKKKLEKRKFNKAKKEIALKIDKLSMEGKSFKEAAKLLGGRILLSNVFKIGDPIKQSGKKGRMVYSISNSKIFQETYLSLEKGLASKVIDSFDGLYIFTPMKKKFKLKEPRTADYDRISNRLVYEKNNAIYMSMMSSLRDKSEITKNLKYN